LNDESGSLDVTLWDSFGTDHGSILPAQIVFIQGLRIQVLTTKDDKETLIGNLIKCQQSELYTITTIPGILNSNILYIPIILLNSINNLNFICKASIVRWQRQVIKTYPNESFTYDTHTTCKQYLKYDTKICSRCKIETQLIKKEFSLIWTLEDGTASIKAIATPQVNKDLLQISCE